MKERIKIGNEIFSVCKPNFSKRVKIDNIGRVTIDLEGLPDDAKQIENDNVCNVLTLDNYRRSKVLFFVRRCDRKQLYVLR